MIQGLSVVGERLLLMANGQLLEIPMNEKYIDADNMALALYPKDDGMLTPYDDGSFIN